MINLKECAGNVVITVVGGTGGAVSLYGGVVDVGVCVGFAARAIDLVRPNGVDERTMVPGPTL